MRLVNGSSHTPVAVDYETGQLWRDEDTGFCRQVPWHQGGEIIVKVQGSGREYIPYWRNPDATAKKLEHNVFQKGDCYYRTGDVLRRTPDGMWFFADRIADTFRWKGRDVATADVAEVMGSFPGVGQALVYGVAVPGKLPYLPRHSSPGVGFRSGGVRETMLIFVRIKVTKDEQAWQLLT